MVEIVNPQDAVRVGDGVCTTCGTVVDLDQVVLNQEEVRQDKLARVVDGDLIARAVKASAQCGSCDFGLVEFGCSCKDGEDPRAVIVDLVRALEKFGERAQLLSASTMGEAYDRLEELLQAEQSVAVLGRDLDAANAENDSLGRTLEQAAKKNDELVRELEQARRQTAEELIAAIETEAATGDEAVGAYIIRRWLEKEPSGVSLRDLVVDARSIVLRALELGMQAAQDTPARVHPQSPFMQSMRAWLEKEGMR